MPDKKFRVKCRQAKCLQIWKVAVNVLNKQLCTVDKMWSPSVEPRIGTNSPSPQKQLLYYEIIYRTLDMRTNGTVYKSMVVSCEYGN